VAAACTDAANPGDDDSTQPPPDISPTAVYLSPAQHLTRASMVLRGIRPSVAEIQQVEADPKALESIVDGYLDSPLFGQTIRELHNETLLMQIEQPTFTFPAMGPIATATARQINGRFEEPLRLIEDVVMSDQPYTAIVTADYTRADQTTASIWGLPHSGPAATWERTKFGDGRAPVGILSTNAIYDRWRSTGANYNRGRANLVSRSLLCHDFLASDIIIDTSVDLSDPAVVANAVVANPSCAGCHQTLDPLASHLFTFKRQMTPVSVDAYPLTMFSPGTAGQWRTTNKRPPMFFGESTGGTLSGLGIAIANDPRFAQCTARRFASYFTEVGRNDVSASWVARLQKKFVDSGFNAKALAKAIVLSDEFRISHDTDAAAAENTVGMLKVRPEQLQRMLRDITGYNWSVNSTATLRGIPYGQANLLESDYIGYRVLAGGIDGYFVSEPVHTMNATSTLTAKLAASQAANFVVDHDAAAAAADRTLFTEAAVTATDADRIRAQLAYLHARIYGEIVAPDSPEVEDAYVMYDEAFQATNNRARAWKVVLIGMLSNVSSLFY
jgi:hypothetical protein